MTLYQPEGHAVWAGRFQPFHIGHLDTLMFILRRYDSPLAVMLIQSTGWPAEAGSISTMIDQQHIKEKNPFTIWERSRMVRLALTAEGLTDRVEVVGIPRPDTLWPAAESFYPSPRFICITERDSLDKEKLRIWTSRGENVELLPVRKTEWSSTAMKTALRDGQDWHRFLHPSVHSYFESIDGVERLIKSV